MDSDTGDDQGSASTAPPKQHEGFMKRMLKRGLEDQKGLYAAPFKPSNIKWDIVVLAGTGAFLATDRRIETHVSHSNFQVYQNISNASLAGLSVSLAGVWLYGIKTDNPHAKETGELAVETLANTFLFYAPMQFIAGRQRPDEGNGKVDFLKHQAMNSSFPAGHAMFTFAMASVIAHEYPKLWVQVLAYGAATTVAFSRARASISQRQLDVFVDSEVADKIEGLKNESDFAVANARPLADSQLRNRLAIEPIMSVGRRIQ